MRVSSSVFTDKVPEVEVHDCKTNGVCLELSDGEFDATSLRIFAGSVESLIQLGNLIMVKARALKELPITDHCDVCGVPITLDNLGQGTVDTVLCKACCKKAEAVSAGQP